MLGFLFSCQEETSSASSEAMSNDTHGQAMESENPEDCDEKANDAEEIVEATLNGGDAGCTIE